VIALKIQTRLVIHLVSKRGKSGQAVYQHILVSLGDIAETENEDESPFTAR
jgi:hypothetical protein